MEDFFQRETLNIMTAGLKTAQDAFTVARDVASILQQYDNDEIDFATLYNMLTEKFMLSVHTAYLLIGVYVAGYEAAIEDAVEEDDK